METGDVTIMSLRQVDRPPDPRPPYRLSKRIAEHVAGMEILPAAIAHMALVAALKNPSWARGVVEELEHQFGNSHVDAAAADFIEAAYLTENRS